MDTPSTPILDDFNRANGAPGANWLPEIFNNYTAFTIVSNTLARNAANWESNYWATGFGPRQEVYVTIATPVTGTFMSLVARLANPDNDAAVDCYELQMDAGNAYLMRIVDNVRTQLGANLGVAFAAGDAAKLECDGDQITAYRKPSGGAWGSLGSRTDATITAGGFIGVVTSNATAAAFDDFGGGTMPGPGFDLATEVERTATTDPQTWTHTTSASPKGVVVAVVHGTSSTDHVSTITYGGVSMGEVVRAVDTTTEAGAAELWFLGSGIPTGNQTVSVDLASATTDDIHFMCFTVTADADTEVIDFDSLQAENANPTVSLSKGGRLGWSVAAMYGGGSAPGGTLAGGNTLGPIFDLGVFYSQSCYETTVDTADHTIGWSTLGGDDLAFVALCLAEVATAAPSLIYRPRPMIRNI